MNAKKIISGVALSSTILMAMSASATNTNPFETKCLDKGYKNTSECKNTEAKCGEGKCGAMDKSSTKKSEAKCGEGKCGAMKKPTTKKSEAKCGEGKCGH